MYPNETNIIYWLTDCLSFSFPIKWMKIIQVTILSVSHLCIQPGELINTWTWKKVMIIFPKLVTTYNFSQLYFQCINIYICSWYMIHVLCITNIFFPKFYRYCSIIYELKVCNCQQWTNSWLAWVCGPACSMELYQWNTTDNYDLNCQTCQSLAKKVVGNVDIGIWWNSINRIIQYNVEWLFMLLTSIS